MLSENRRAKFDYEILEKIEAGLALTGQETKSAKIGRLGIHGSYAIIKNGETWLINSSLPPYQANNTDPHYDPTRNRKLLLRKNQIAILQGKLKQKGFVLIPLKAYLKKNLIKIELGLGRSRKKSDQREYLKKRVHQREMRQV